MSFCSSCGTALGAGARFCGTCGSQVAGAASANLRPDAPAPTPRPVGRIRSPARATGATGPVVLYVAPPDHADRLRVAEDCATDHTAVCAVASGPQPVQERLRALDAAGTRVAAVCLLGTDDELPHARFADDTGLDTWVLTDNDYGMMQSASDEARASALVLPDVPVCRIPSADPTLQERLLRMRGELPDSWAGGVAVSCAVWEGASAAVLRAIARTDRPGLTQVPPDDSDAVAAQLGPGAQRLYFNVHGSNQVAYWVGDGDGAYPPALHPSAVQVARNAILVSEACYGARHDNADGTPISSSFFAAGGGAFVGSTIVAWGPVRPPIGSADLIVTGVYEALDAGHPLPAALLAAKARIMQSEGEPLSPVTRNTLSSFVAYGGPLASVGSAAKRQPRPAGAGTWASAPPVARSAGTGDVLGRTRASRSGRTAGPLAAARARLAERAARLGYTPVAQQALSLADVQRRFPRARDLQARLQVALQGGGKVLQLRYAARIGIETALVATPADAGYTQMFVVDRMGAVRRHLVSHGVPGGV